MKQKRAQKVIIRTPSRLHFSLIDLHGGLGRIDGSVGVALNRPGFIIEVEQAEKWHIPAQCSEIINRITANIKPKSKYKIRIRSKIPAHVGLGSQTQLSLAIAKGLSVLERWKCSVRELAAVVGRGGTSGIGVAAFEAGGLIVDGGHSRALKPYFAPSHYSFSPPPPVLVRYQLPENWYFVIAVPQIEKRIFGETEKQIFDRFCPIAGSEVEKVTRIVMMSLLPSVIEQDIKSFGFALTSLQYVGFKKIENELAPPVVGKLRAFMEKNSFGGGLSSFGPAVFGIVRGRTAAFALKLCVSKFLHAEKLEHRIYIAHAQNSGAKIFITDID